MVLNVSYDDDVVLESQVLVSRLSFNVLVSVLVLGCEVLVLISSWTLQALVLVATVRRLFPSVGAFSKLILC